MLVTVLRFTVGTVYSWRCDRCPNVVIDRWTIPALARAERHHERKVHRRLVRHGRRV